MSRLDEALVALAGVAPTFNNSIVSIGQEMADRYQNKRQLNPRENFAVHLTPLQKKMVAAATKNR